ncbi:uncharacterized protein SCHCODRAFT_02094333 [Schizophyllum commune H4-8]|uniref:uncharacterized protein n=1 Tax=Schizophyllum commune (strain H4-8 / FGSC 9210) TaxID=578458 RepID=UPI00215F2569|nr:uncharacterized protein SCHCODRAFT_02094333 [Schizophyllum commune H4-8]KAI5886277.1 hypothetical protein SCHCODRAFT_02094333 [Schizophyllum commune H4-8]
MHSILDMSISNKKARLPCNSLNIAGFPRGRTVLRRFSRGLDVRMMYHNWRFDGASFTLANLPMKRPYAGRHYSLNPAALKQRIHVRSYASLILCLFRPQEKTSSFFFLRVDRATYVLRSLQAPIFYPLREIGHLKRIYTIIRFEVNVAPAGVYVAC